MFKSLLLAAGVFGLGTMNTHSHTLCTGIVPPNDHYIGVDDTKDANMTQAEFNQVLDRIERVYDPIFAQMGGTLRLNRKWSDGTVNASAQRMGSTWVVNMFGGLARHEELSLDGFAMVACHEVGHHIGGAPKNAGWFSSWASNEGQSDYFASLKCMREIYTDQEHMDFLRNVKVEPYVEDNCMRAFTNPVDQGACFRSAVAGMSLAETFKALKDEDVNPRYENRDRNTVDRTNDRHPATQCRLDTYVAGAFCNRLINDSVSQRDPKPGTCLRDQGYTIEARPTCWYKPI